MNAAGEATAAPSPTARQSIAHCVRNGVLFAVAFAATGLLLGRFLPFPSVPEIAPRFRYFAEHKDEFDTIFIGSSRVRHHVIPTEFDRETAARGAPTHSFNLGYSGMWPPESYYYLRQILALHPRQLRWVVIELMDYRFGQAEGQATTARSVYWHDAQHTGMTFRLVMESPFPATEKIELLTTHAGLFLQRLSNFGRGDELLAERYSTTKKKSGAGSIKRGGFDPEEPGEWSERTREEYAQKIRAFEQARGGRLARPGLAVAVQEIMNDVRRAGAEPIFVLPPTVRAEEHLAAGLPPGMTIWEFDDPAQFPRLYLPELHYDPGHLNAAGAREFTGLLAQRLADFAHRR